MTAEPRFRPADIERLAGVDPDTQRDWRRRGFLEEYGEAQGTGRWAYTLTDMIAFYVARRLMATGMDRLDAASVAAVHGPTVAMFMQDQPAPYRFVARVMDASEVEGAPAQRFKRVNSLGELDKTTFDRVEAIDLGWLATQAPEELLEVVRFYAPQVPD